jgi:hypothetical protein
VLLVPFKDAFQLSTVSAYSTVLGIRQEDKKIIDIPKREGFLLSWFNQLLLLGSVPCCQYVYVYVYSTIALPSLLRNRGLAPSDTARHRDTTGQWDDAMSAEMSYQLTPAYKCSMFDGTSPATKPSRIKRLRRNK